jgi:hypothetical protein
MKNKKSSSIVYIYIVTLVILYIIRGKCSEFIDFFCNQNLVSRKFQGYR